jgi:hypothetical protein
LGGRLLGRWQRAVDFCLSGIILLVRASGRDISCSGRGRLAAESCWLPSSLLPGGRLRWRASDEETSEVLLDLDEEQVAVRFIVGMDGRRTDLQMQRWDDLTDDMTFALMPFGGHLKEKLRFGDYTIPTQVSIEWWYGTERYA